MIFDRLWKSPEGQGAALGLTLICLPAAPALFGLAALGALAVDGTCLAAGAISAARAKAQKEKEERESCEFSYQYEKQRQDDELRRNIEWENEAQRRIALTRQWEAEEQERKHPKPRPRMEVLAEIQQEYADNLMIAGSIHDPITQMAVLSRVNARYRERLARLIG